MTRGRGRRGGGVVGREGVGKVGLLMAPFMNEPKDLNFKFLLSVLKD